MRSACTSAIVVPSMRAISPGCGVSDARARGVGAADRGGRPARSARRRPPPSAGRARRPAPAPAPALSGSSESPGPSATASTAARELEDAVLGRRATGSGRPSRAAARSCTPAPEAGDDGLLGGGRRRRAEADAAPERGAPGERRRAGLAERARDDQQVTVACPCGRRARAAERTGARRRPRGRQVVMPRRDLLGRARRCRRRPRAPACAAAGWRSRHRLSPAKVTVSAAAPSGPSSAPPSEPSPEGRSSATTGTPSAPARLIGLDGRGDQPARGAAQRRCRAARPR